MKKRILFFAFILCFQLFSCKQNAESNYIDVLFDCMDFDSILLEVQCSNIYIRCEKSRTTERVSYIGIENEMYIENNELVLIPKSAAHNYIYIDLANNKKYNKIKVVSNNSIINAYNLNVNELDFKSNTGYFQLNNCNIDTFNCSIVSNFGWTNSYLYNSIISHFIYVFERIPYFSMEGNILYDLDICGGYMQLNYYNNLVEKCRIELIDGFCSYTLTENEGLKLLITAPNIVSEIPLLNIDNYYYVGEATHVFECVIDKGTIVIK